MKALGIMQGRLSPKYKGRYQAFPVDTWQKEFDIARDLGLDCIEFILDKDAEVLSNPLMNEHGLRKIKDCIEKTGVKVLTVCADYFMANPIFNEDQVKQKKSMEVFSTLLRSSKSLGVNDIIIPCVDESSLKNDPLILQRFIDSLSRIIPLAQSLGVNLSLETDLGPKPFYDLVKTFNSKYVKINYDTGNSASLGYDVHEEIRVYGALISTLHIKDRKKNGGSVILGQGDADIGSALEELRKYNYQGPVILQAYRDDEGVAIFQQQLNWFKVVSEKYYPEMISVKKE